MAATATPSRYLLLSAREGRDALTAHARTLGVDLRDYHTSLFREYREEVRRAFLGHRTLVPVPDGQPEEHWDANAALADGVLDDLLLSLDELSAALADEDIEIFEDELDAAMVEGEHRMLWLLALGGIEDVE